MRPRLDLRERETGDLLALSADAPEPLDTLVDGDQRAQRRGTVDQPKPAPVTIQLCW